MGTYRQTFLYNFSTSVTFLCGEAGVHSNDFMSSVCSFGSKYVEEGTPTGIENAFREMKVLDHVEDTQILNDNPVIGLGILPSDFEMVIPPLSLDLEMSLGSVASGLAAAVTTLPAPRQLTLLASEGSGARAIEARIRNRISFRISKKDFQPYINADVRMGTFGWLMLIAAGLFARNQGIPMSISTMHEIDRLGLAFYRAMQFDLEEVTYLLGYDEMFLILMQIAIFAILPQLNRVPSVRFLEPGEAHVRNTQLFGSQITFECLSEPISKTLHGGGWHMLPPTAFEGGIQVVLARERAILLILGLESCEHLIIEVPCLDQAPHEQLGLFLIRIEAILKHFHAYILLGSLEFFKCFREAMRAAFHPHALSGRGPQAAFW